MNILLIGSKSFIGNNIYEKLKKEFNINILPRYFDDNDILELDNQNFCKKYFNSLPNDIKTIVYVAHIHKKKYEDETNINSKLAEKIIYFQRKKNSKLIFFSSVNSSNNAIHNKYSYSKFLVEQIVKDTENFVIMRLSTVIHFDDLMGYVGGKNGTSFKLINFFINKVKVFPLINNGNFIHTICFLEDIAKFLKIIIISDNFKNQTINFFSGEYILFKDLIKSFAKKYKSEVYFINIPYFLIKILTKFLEFFNLFGIKEQQLNNLLNQKIMFDMTKDISKIIKLKKLH